MASDTPSSYRNLVIYEIYVRNHGTNGHLPMWRGIYTACTRWEWTCSGSCRSIPLGSE